MKTKYKYIHFIKMYNKPIEVWLCQNNKDDDPLGTVEYYRPWNTLVFDPDLGAIFSADCLADIQHFMGQLEQAREVGVKFRAKRPRDMKIPLIKTTR